MRSSRRGLIEWKIIYGHSPRLNTHPMMEALELIPIPRLLSRKATLTASTLKPSALRVRSKECEAPAHEEGASRLPLT